MSAVTPAGAQLDAGSLTQSLNERLTPAHPISLASRPWRSRSPGAPCFRKIYQAAPKEALGPPKDCQPHKDTSLPLL